MTETVLCIGSNCGDRRRNVGTALRWLSEILTDFRHSHIYATPDCHGGDRIYMNAVCFGRTLMDAGGLERLCKEFEFSLGRDASARANGDVPVDVDIVMFDGYIVRERDYASEFFIEGYRTLFP